MDDRIDMANYPGEKSVEASPAERLVQENEKMLAMLNETVSELRNRLRPVTSSALRAEEGLNSTEADTPRIGSSMMVDALYTQQAQINRANRGLRDILRNLEV